MLSGETCYAQFLSYLLLFPPGPQRRGGGRDWDKDRVTHPGGVARGQEAVLEGAGTGVPGRTRQYSEGPG